MNRHTLPEIPEGFTPWHGGENPVPGKRVVVIYANGERDLEPVPSEDYWWLTAGCNTGWEVIAYRVIE
jgi:hypothetical protein